MDNEPSGAVIIDASVAINLNATGCAERIIACLPIRIAMTDIAAAELDTDARSGRDDAAMMAALVDAGLVRVVQLDPAVQAIFADLVIGPAADTLDDGEASTIAYAVANNQHPAIDERKALRICAQRFPSLRLMSSVDLLMHPAVSVALGHDTMAGAVFAALHDARMRVLPGQVDQVVRLIGPGRARQCPGLPAAVRR